MKNEEINGRFKMSDNFDLFYRLWKPIVPSNNILVCIHGFGGHSLRFKPFGESLAALGVTVYALDLRGFGNSKELDLPRGDTKDFKRHLEDINEVITLLKNQYRDAKLFMLGLSLGGCYTLWYGANYPVSLSGLILMAPAIEVKAKTTDGDRQRIPFLMANAPQTMIETKRNQQIVESNTIEHQVMDSLRTSSFSVRYLYGIGSFLMRNQALKNAENIKNPTLIIQGDADEEAAPSGAMRLFESLAVDDKRIEMIHGADHTFSFHSRPSTEAEERKGQIFTTIWEWLRAH